MGTSGCRLSCRPRQAVPHGQGTEQSDCILFVYCHSIQRQPRSLLALLTCPLRKEQMTSKQSTCFGLTFSYQAMYKHTQRFSLILMLSFLSENGVQQFYELCKMHWYTVTAVKLYSDITAVCSTELNKKHANTSNHDSTTAFPMP